jgi:hypothetical protein
MSKIRVCSICQSPKVTKSTCPLNKNAKNKNYKGHINATLKIKDYIKNKRKQKLVLNSQSKAKKKNIANATSIQIEPYCVKFPRIIVLDNDECLGQFGMFSSLYIYARMLNDPYTVNIEELRNACVKYLFPRGVARPYLIHLFRLLKKMKKNGWIDSVIMYTSAPNNLSDGKSGYVYFLKDCIEQYCNAENIYDKVLHRNNVKAKTSSCGATIKDLANTLLNHCQRKMYASSQNSRKKIKIKKYVTVFSKNIIMIDDKPTNIKCQSGKVIGISPYEYECNKQTFEQCINSVKNLKKKLRHYKIYNSLLTEIHENHIKYQKQKTNNELVYIMKRLKEIYIKKQLV